MTRASRRLILLAAQAASKRGDHAEAARLFAALNISYVAEVRGPFESSGGWLN